MALSFPPAPTVGDTHEVGARTWRWTGTGWDLLGKRAGTAPGVNALQMGLDLSRWNAAVINGNANVLVIGDSTSSTAPSDGSPDDVWVRLLDLGLADLTNTPRGAGYVNAGGAADTRTFDTQGGAAATNAFAAWGSTLTVGQTAEHTGYADKISLVFTSVVGGGSVEVRDGGSGGTLLATVDTDAAASGGGLWTSAPLTAGVHTIHMTATGGTVVVAGLQFHSGGLAVWNAAHGGYTSEGYTTVTERALDLIGTLDPELVIIATGTNDDPGNYASRITSLIAAVKAAGTGDVLLAVPPVAQSLIASGAFTAGEAELGRAAAVTAAIPVLDLARMLGEYALTPGLSVDGLHPNVRGHRAWARMALTAVTGYTLEALLAGFAATPVVGTSSTDAARGDLVTNDMGDTAVMVDDFVNGYGNTADGNIGQLRWATSGTGTPTVATVAAEAGHPGVIELSTSVAANDETTVTGHPVDLSSATWRAIWWVKVGAAATARTQIGMGAGEHATLFTGVCFERLSTGWWLASYFLGADVGRVQMGAVTADDTWVKLSMAPLLGGIGYFIDDEFQLLGSALTNGVPHMGIKTLTTAAKSLSVDRFSLTFWDLTR